MNGVVSDVDVPAFEPSQARAWGAGPLHWWVPAGVLIAGWVAAGFIELDSMATDCPASDPTVCGPNQPLALALVVMLATPLLLCWIPRLGYLAGILFGLLYAVVGGAPIARLTWGVHALACLIVLVLVIRNADRQRAIAGDGSVTRRLPSNLAGPVSGRRSQFAVLLALVAFGFFGLRGYLVSVENEHLAAAHRVSATVTGMSADDNAVRLALPGVGTREISTRDRDNPLGSQEPVLVDGDWLELVSQPPDENRALVVGLLLLLFAVLLGYREAAAIRWPNPVAHRQFPARRVLVDSNGTKTFLYPVGAGPDEQPFARLRTEPSPSRPYPPAQPDVDPDSGVSFGRAWRDETAPWPRPVEPGLVLGELSTGSWVAVLVGDTVLFPRGPLYRAPEPPRWLTSPADLELDDRGPRPRTWNPPPLPGVAVTAGEVPAGLPWQLRPTPGARLLGYGQILLGLLLTFALMPVHDRLSIHGLLEGSFFLLCCSVPVILGWSRVTQRLTVASDGLTVIGPTYVQRVPWADLHGVRLTKGGRLALAWKPEETFKTVKLPGAPDVAAAIAALRRSAISLQTAAETRRREDRWGWLVLLVALGLAFGCGWVVTLES